MPLFIWSHKFLTSVICEVLKSFEINADYHWFLWELLNKWVVNAAETFTDIFNHYVLQTTANKCVKHMLKRRTLCWSNCYRSNCQREFTVRRASLRAYLRELILFWLYLVPSTMHWLCRLYEGCMGGAFSGTCVAHAVPCITFATVKSHIFQNRKGLINRQMHCLDRHVFI